MNLTINNPHRVGHKKYKIIIAVSFFTLTISFIISCVDCKIICILSDIIKNLSYGCIASTVVAWLIDYANVKNMNKKADEIYDVVYGDLKYHISCFASIWAEFCAVTYKDKDYNKEKNTWIDWYKIAKENFDQLEERQEEIFEFYIQQLEYIITKIRTSIEKIDSQKYLLSINDLVSAQLEGIISDFKFEFGVLNVDDLKEKGYKQFWATMDVIILDLKKYINNWRDIQYYNYLVFRPYKFFDDPNELRKAIVTSENNILDRTSINE